MFAGARWFFFDNGYCFSDLCRHAYIQSVPLDEFRIEALVFKINSFYPWLIYYFDFFLVIILISIKKEINLWLFLVVFIWVLQPSYDSSFILLLMLISFGGWLKGIGSFFAAFFIKAEFLILSLFLSWALKLKFRSISRRSFFLLIIACSFVLLFAGSFFPLYLIEGPPNGSFSGQNFTLIRFFGYIFLPISSLIALDFSGSLSDNFIRLQIFLSSALFLLKLNRYSFLLVFVIICALVAMIVGFYQSRYVVLLVISLQILQTRRRGFWSNKERV